MSARRVKPAEAAALQEILDGSADGSVIELEPGRYPTRLILRRSLTLRGLGTPEEVILDGQGHGSVVKLDRQGLAVTLERLTIANGTATAGGGAISWNKVASLVAREVILRGNRAHRFGGGAVAASLGTLLFEHCRIEENHAPIGAAMLLRGWVKATLRDTQVQDNRGHFSSALAIHDGAEVRLERATVAGNVGDCSIELAGDFERAPTLTVEDSVLSAHRTLLTNDAGAPAEVTIARSVLHGERVLVAGEGDRTRVAGAAYRDGGGNREGQPPIAP